MRLKLNEWNQSGQTEGSVCTKGMESAELESLIRHGRFVWARPVRAVFEMVYNFVMFCRWRGEVHMQGYRVGPVHRRVFQRPRP